MMRFSAKEYDVLICGAGPAGLYAAFSLQKRAPGRFKVAIVDRKSPWREPVSCAEAVSQRILARYWKPNECWIRQHLNGVFFTSPDGTRVGFQQKECGYILDRAKFHHEMADTVASLGVECDFSSEVVGLSRSEDSLWNVELHSGDEVCGLKAKVVIDATGPGSKITRGVPGLESLESGNFDLEPAIFAIAEGIPHDVHHIELLFGHKYFPGGYGWVFPRDGQTVNVGLVNARQYLRTYPPRKTLLKFIADSYPEAKILSVHGGAIPCGQSFRPLAALGVFKAGDAASTVNPISRSGIIEAMKSGKIAGESAVDWLASELEEERRDIEDSIRTRWMDIQGKSHLGLARAKDGFASIKDSQFDRAAHKLASIPIEKRSLFRIFFSVLSSSPSIFWKMRSFFI